MAGILLVGIGIFGFVGSYILLKKSFGFSGDVWTQFIGVLERVGLLVPSWFVAHSSLFTLVAEEIKRAFQEKKHPLSLRAALVFEVFLLIVGAVGGAILATSAMGVPFGLCAIWIALSVWSSRRIKLRNQRISKQIPELFRSLSRVLSSGKTLSQAVHYIGTLDMGTLSQEFARSSMRISCGTSASEAIQELPTRIQALGLNLMITALQISAKTGAPLERLFARLAALTDQRFGLERELQTKTAQARLSARIVSGLPVILVTLLACISPDYQRGLATQAGIFCIVFALVLDAVALLIIRRLMRGVMP